jgi:hypothetical protein
MISSSSQHGTGTGAEDVFTAGAVVHPPVTTRVRLGARDQSRSKLARPNQCSPAAGAGWSGRPSQQAAAGKRTRARAASRQPHICRATQQSRAHGPPPASVSRPSPLRRFPCSPFRFAFQRLTACPTRLSSLLEAKWGRVNFKKWRPIEALHVRPASAFAHAGLVLQGPMVRRFDVRGLLVNDGLV